jgi:hypothetical protein
VIASASLAEKWPRTSHPRGGYGFVDSISQQRRVGLRGRPTIIYSVSQADPPAVAGLSQNSPDAELVIDD